MSDSEPTLGDAVMLSEHARIPDAALEAIREAVNHGRPIDPSDAADLLSEIDYLRKTTLSEASLEDARAVLVQVLADDLDAQGAENGCVTEFPTLGLTLIVQRTGKLSHVEVMDALRGENVALQDAADALARAAKSAVIECTYLSGKEPCVCNTGHRMVLGDAVDRYSLVRGPWS